LRRLQAEKAAQIQRDLEEEVEKSFSGAIAADALGLSQAEVGSRSLWFLFCAELDHMGMPPLML
jgi:hypothetical protein